MKEVNGVVFATWKESDINLDIAKAFVNERIELTGGKDVLLIADCRNMKSITKDARNYLAKDGEKGVTACAIVVKSTMSKVIANFFLSINTPKIPIQTFTEEKIALTWINLYK